MGAGVNEGLQPQVIPLVNTEYITEIEYLATPYTHDDPLIEDYRAMVSDKIAADLTADGRVIFAPISAWHHISRKHKLPGLFEYWLKLDEEFLKICKTMIIITLPGWRESRGVNAEINIAETYYIPIIRIDPIYAVKELELVEELYYGKFKRQSI